MVLGATGTIGRATCAALLAEGHRVIAPVRSGSDTSDLPKDILRREDFAQILAQEPVDAIISCLASRTGLDAWDVDYDLNSRALKAALTAGVSESQAGLRGRVASGSTDMEHRPTHGFLQIALGSGRASPRGQTFPAFR